MTAISHASPRGSGDLDIIAAALAQLEALVDEYVRDYEMRGEDEQGRDGCYTPSDDERLLIADAIAGLLADETFTAKFNRWQDLVRDAVCAPVPIVARGDKHG